jgi:hypothetical protein
MKTKFKLLTLSASLLAGGLVLSEQAQAGAYAFSYNHIQNGFIDVTGGTATITRSSSSTSTSGTPLPVTSPGDLVVGTTPNASPATQGSPVRTDETIGGNPNVDATGYTQFGRGGATSYSWADGNTVSEQTATTLIDIRNAAEGNIHGGVGSATSGAENSSSSLLQMTTVLGAPGTLGFSFQANPYLEAFVHNDGSVASANLDNNLTITAVDVAGFTLGDVMFSWAPDGSINLVPGLIGGTETADGENLNLSINDLVADGLDVRYSDNGATFSNFAAISGLLPAGTYTISLFTQESQLVDKVGVVPEPATLALVGLGMLGIGFAGRRRRHV